MRTTATTLYVRIGGKAALKGIVSHFCERLQADELLAPVFFGADQERQRADLLAFLTAALDGSQGDRGGEPQQVHAGIDLRDGHFDRLDLHLRTTLLDNGVQPQDAEEILATVAALRRPIAT
jgi:truncated hemoglobin YjbI